jgi:hypothetical protein
MAVSVSTGSASRRGRVSLVAATLVAAAIGGAAYVAVTHGSSSAAAAGKAEETAATVQPIGKTGIDRIILSPVAAKRLGIRTGVVSTRLVDGRRRLTIPYAAILYHANGVAWTYVSPKPHVFVPHDITVTSVNGDVAILKAGPRLGSRVVTVGAPEIWGVAFGSIDEAPEASGD